MHKIFSKNLFIGKKVVYLPKCHSTNEIAGELASSGQGGEGTVVIADQQTAGRGQRGSSWESEAGKNLTFSVILTPRFLVTTRQFGLTQITSLALKEALTGLGVPHVSVKWPNDIYCGKKKIAGILIENSLKGNIIENSVVGIGLNVNQTDFSVDRATSVQLETGQHTDRQHLLGLVLENLESLYLQLKSANLEQLEQRYLDSLLGFGRSLSYRDISGTFKGRILGVTQQGKLRMLRETTEREYGMKELEFML